MQDCASRSRRVQSLGLLLALAEPFPALFDASHGALVAMVQEARGDALLASLRVLRAVAARMSDGDLKATLREPLLRLCAEGSAEQAKTAALTIGDLFATPGVVYSAAVSRLVGKDLSTSNKHLPAVLKAIATIAVAHPAAFEDSAEIVTGWVMEEVLCAQRSKQARSSASNRARDTALRVLGTKVR